MSEMNNQEEEDFLMESFERGIEYIEDRYLMKHFMYLVQRIKESEKILDGRTIHEILNKVTYGRTTQEVLYGRTTQENLKRMEEIANAHGLGIFQIKEGVLIIDTFLRMGCCNYNIDAY